LVSYNLAKLNLHITSSPQDLERSCVRSADASAERGLPAEEDEKGIATAEGAVGAGMPRACLALAGLDTRIFNAYHSDSGYAHSVATFDSGGFWGPPMTFRIGEKVVYPNQGVGTIEEYQHPLLWLRARKVLSASLRIWRHDCVGAVFPCFQHRTAESYQRRRFRASFPFSPTAGAPSARWKVRFKQNREKLARRDLFKAAEVSRASCSFKSTAALLSREGNARPRVSHADRGNLHRAKCAGGPAPSTCSSARWQSRARSAGAAVKVQNLLSRMQSPHLPLFRH